MKLLKDIRVSHVLARARDIVAARWVQDSYVSGPNGEDKSNLYAFLGIPDDDQDDWGYCGDGALRRAVKMEMAKWQEKPKNSEIETILHGAQKALSKAIQKRIPSIADHGRRSHQQVWCFNDMPSTTKEDMLAAYDDAITDQCEVVKIKTDDENRKRVDRQNR